MSRICRTCATNLATHGMTVCAVCDAHKRLADEAAYRAAVDANYKAARAHMATIGSATFVPETDAERRLHRQARSKINFGNGGY